MSVFRYALESPESQRQYPRRFKVFLDYLGLNGTIQQQAIQFANKAASDPKWFHESFMKFIVYQKEHVSKKGDIGRDDWQLL